MSEYPSPCACDGRFSGISSMKMAKSVPWSRLKPRRKYWFALPPPACCVMMTTGNRLQNFSRTKNRTILDFLCAHRSLGGGIGNSDKIILPALHVYGGAHGAHSQRDAQWGRRPSGPYGDGHFFGFKIRIRYDESIITCRESRNHEGAVPVRLCRSLYSTVRASNLHGSPGNHRA